MLVLKICISEWKNASRDQRELLACRELGADVKVVAKGGGYGRDVSIDYVAGFDVYRLSARPFQYLPVSLNRILSIFMWAIYVRKMGPDIISGHDLGGMTIGWLSALFLKGSRRPALVYDSHEFEAGQDENHRKLRTKLIIWWERFMIKHSAFMIVVNENIADEVVKLHRLRERPVVVRNIPPVWSVNQNVCADVRRQMLHELSEGMDQFIVMYHGGVAPGRGIESIIELLRLNRHIAGVVLGDGEKSYLESLQLRAEEYGVRQRLLFYPAVKNEDLWRFAGAVDAELILAPAVCLNYYYSLPNKFFESIQSETPVVCPFYPAMKDLTDRYGVGLTCDPDNITEINECIERLRTDKRLYDELKQNVRRAKKELCWERERKKLMEAYGRIMERKREAKGKV